MERYKDGTIKDFSVVDAHTLYVEVSGFVKKTIGGQIRTYERIFKKEAIQLSSLDDLEKLYLMKDPDDGFIVADKWNIRRNGVVNRQVIEDLKSKGEAMSEHFTPYLKFVYWIRKTKYADELKHKG